MLSERFDCFKLMNLIHNNAIISKIAKIGAGTVVINDIPDGATIVGNRGRVIKIDNNYDLINYDKIVNSK